MTVVAQTAIHPKPGASWEDLQKLLKKANDLVRKKHGGENVTVMATIAGGPTTGTLSVVATSADWASYGKLQDAIMADPRCRPSWRIRTVPSPVGTRTSARRSRTCKTRYVRQS
jgi:hypothetical protein